MSNYEELIHGFDGLAASLGPTPVFNEMGDIVPIGQPEGLGRSTIYVVWVGRAVGLFHNWGIASAMVTGFAGSSHKGFRSLESARRAWLQGPTAGVGNWQPPPPRPAIPTPVDPRAASPSSGSQPLPDGEEIEWELHLSRDVSIPAIGHSGSNSGDDIDDHENGQHGPEDDEQLYWRHCHYDNPEAREGVDLISSTISSVSSLSLSPSPSLTAGTISPGPVETPTLFVGTISPHSTPRITSRALPVPEVPFASRPAMSPGFRSRAATSSCPLLPRDSASPVHASRPPPPPPPPSRVRASRPSSSQAPASGSKARIPSAVEVVAVPRPKEFFVVIRGEHPGIYMDRNTALLMLGTRPGMKLVIFKSLSRAAWYFVQQYMARKVGVPVMTSEI